MTTGPPFGVAWLSLDQIGAEALGAPASRGVAAFVDRQGRAVLIAATGDVRGLIRRRLADAEAGPGAAELRAVVERVGVVCTASLLEAELAFLGIAQDLAPSTYAAAVQRRLGWFVWTDPEAPFPKLEKRSTAMLAGHDDAAARGRLMGPIRDKHAAGRAIEQLEDAFDLCRFHHILVQAPNATACVYKELGKCPAPCDGGETLASYRERVAEAARFGEDPAAWRAGAEAAMAEAAAGLDFERAARLKAQLEALGALTQRGGGCIGPGWRDGWVVLAPAPDRAAVSLLAVGPYPAAPAGAVDATVGQDAASDGVLEGLAATAGASRRPTDAAGWHAVGLMTDWLYKGGARSPVWIVERGSVERWDEAAQRGWAAAAEAARRAGGGPGSSSDEGRGLEIEPINGTDGPGGPEEGSS